jgi:hypothetical protein
MLQLLRCAILRISTGEKYSWNGLENDLAFKFSERYTRNFRLCFIEKETRKIASSNYVIRNFKTILRYLHYCDKKFNYLSDHHPVISTVELK